MYAERAVLETRWDVGASHPAEGGNGEAFKFSR
jgi:hypothetical protein